MSKRDRAARQEQAQRMRIAEERRQRRGRVVVAGVAVVSVLAVVLTVGLIIGSSGEDDTPVVRPAAVVTDDAAIVTGESSAPVTVDVYLDYQCPACRSFEEAVGPQLDALVAQGAVELRSHPVSILDRATGTRFSTRSANAAFCVAEEAGEEVFTTFNAQMFVNQPTEGGGAGLSDAEISTIATLAGAPDTTATCIDEGRYLGYVGEATDLARASGEGGEPGLPGTPWVKVDGSVVADPNQVLPAVQQALEAAGGVPEPTGTETPEVTDTPTVSPSTPSTDG